MKLRCPTNVNPHLVDLDFDVLYDRLTDAVREETFPGMRRAC